MSHLICNIPNQKVWVRREYLRDLEDGHGEFVEGHWVTAKSIPGRAFYFETFLPEYGALFDKLPISAFVSSPETLEVDMALPDLQFWNCMDYGVTCIQKQFIGSMDYEVWTKNHGRVKGSYIATLDNYHIHSDEVDYSTAEQPDEHKSINLLELETGSMLCIRTIVCVCTIIVSHRRIRRRRISKYLRNTIRSRMVTSTGWETPRSTITI